MFIGGLQKTTSLDYPGLLACTVFTVGCNFRCPFCHNRFLVTLPNFKESGERQIPEEEFFSFLKKRQGLLDGVCITGGEPTLHPDLPEFCQKIKALGFKLKLDTNGSNPKMLEELYRQKLLDFVAMDLKTALDDYSSVVGRSVILSEAKNPSDADLRDPSRGIQDDISQSISLILASGLDFEFRTTIVPGLHNKQTLLRLVTDIKEAAEAASVPVSKISWYLQNFRPSNCLDPLFNDKEGFSEAELLGFIKALKSLVPLVKQRT